MDNEVQRAQGEPQGQAPGNHARRSQGGGPQNRGRLRPGGRAYGRPGSPCPQLLRGGYVQALLGGNAIALHDIEHTLYRTSLGVDLTHGQPVAHGHKNQCGPSTGQPLREHVPAAVEQGVLKSGIMYECVKNKVPFVLAGSIRDDGPLPDVEMDMIKAQEGYARELKDASVVLMLSSMLHGIGAGT